MKLLTAIMLASRANRVHQKKKKITQDDRGKLQNAPECSSVNWDQAEFSYSSQDTSGRLELTNYENKMNCVSTITTSCAAVKVRIQDMAIEYEENCGYDYMRFAWDNYQGTKVMTDKICSCEAEACNTPILHGDYDDSIYESNGFDSLSDVNIANEYFIYANDFKVLFKSDVSYMGGGFTLKWECLDDEEAPTTQPATAMPATTSMTSTTSTTWSTTTDGETTTDYTTSGSTASPTTTSTATTTSGTTTSPRADNCNVELVQSMYLCEYPGGTTWKNDFMRQRYPRLANFAEVKAQKANWEDDLRWWYIVGFANGMVNGEGYGGQINREKDVYREFPNCQDFGAFLMCQSDEVTTTTSTYTTTTTSAWTTSYCEYRYDSGLCDDGDVGYYGYGYYDYYYDYDYSTSAPDTTTTPIVTAGDDSCYRHHAGYEEFMNAVYRGMERAMDNDVYTYSRRPGRITPGARQRRQQWLRWLNRQLLGIAVDIRKERSCVVDKFPTVDYSFGDFDKQLLGKDCALDLYTIDDICSNLSRLMKWQYSDCQNEGEKKRARLEFRCRRIQELRTEIQAAAARSFVGKDMEQANKDIIKHNKQAKGTFKKKKGEKKLAKKPVKNDKKNKNDKKKKN